MNPLRANRMYAFIENSFSSSSGQSLLRCRALETAIDQFGLEGPFLFPEDEILWREYISKRQSSDFDMSPDEENCDEDEDFDEDVEFWRRF